MINITLKGGLGNQMFQYAHGRNLELSGKNITFNTSFYKNNRAQKDTAREFKLNNFNIQTKAKFTDEKSIFLNLTKRLNALLKKEYGFFQSENYFKSIRPQLLQEFTLKSAIKNQSLLNEIQNSESVAIHIRRGDYVNNKETNAYHGTPPIEYYKSAIAQINSTHPNAVFYFFSDEIDWVKQNFPVDNIKMKIGTDPNLTDCEELILMSKCKHNIIANSSFSWWSAWLNQNPDKIVIAPKNWRVGKTSNELETLPKNWIQI